MRNASVRPARREGAVPVQWPDNELISVRLVGRSAAFPTSVCDTCRCSYDEHRKRGCQPRRTGRCLAMRAIRRCPES